MTEAAARAGRPVLLVLAGGRATRMGGGDKALRPFGGTTLLDHVLARMAGQRPHRTVLSANGSPARLARFGLPVLPDTVPGFPGPLAGVLAGLEWTLAHAPATTDLVTVPTDSPFLPPDLIDRLLAARTAAGAALACAASAGRVHPVVGLWPVSLAPLLRRALVEERFYRIGRWAARFDLVQVPFDTGPVDPFLNINTPEDLAAAEPTSASPHP